MFPHGLFEKERGRVVVADILHGGQEKVYSLEQRPFTVTGILHSLDLSRPRGSLTVVFWGRNLSVDSPLSP